ncbi:hypothetical protein [Mucisphaera calidilacus]|uniref:Uncharacterized protein n=1 Tax=Mucisphaera calidilacus TaxID=2527982 RepID=A0A518BVL8_9BACT|nr:hypothetical protein [Mucisphaera calidilacus]QDU71019.1 hypothetical protein Pan265_08640 [Mucisphaera calidilacus]
MVPAWLTALLLMLGEAWSVRRDARLRFVLAQIELLKARVPGNRVILSPDERLLLLKLGSAVGHDVHDLVGIVSVKTYKRWLRQQQGGRAPGQVGRPPKVTASLRPHQSLENTPPEDVGKPPPTSTGWIRRERTLGGLLNHDYRKAA